MAVVDDDARMLLQQPLGFPAQRCVIRIEVECRGARRSRLQSVRSRRAIERLAVERRRGAELRGRLARIERLTARIAIDVDDRARDVRAYDRRVELRSRSRTAPARTSPHPCARATARSRRPSSPRRSDARVRHAEQQRRGAAPNVQPLGMRCHALRSGEAAASERPTAAAMAPARTSVDGGIDIGMHVAIVLQLRARARAALRAPLRAACSTSSAHGSRTPVPPRAARWPRPPRRSRSSAAGDARRARPSRRDLPGSRTSEWNPRSPERPSACSRTPAPRRSPAES